MVRHLLDFNVVLFFIVSGVSAEVLSGKGSLTLRYFANVWWCRSDHHMAHDLSLRHLFVSASFGPFWCIVFIRILYCMIRKFATSGSSNFYIQQLFHFMFISLKKKISYIIQYHEFKLVTTHMRLWFKWFGLHVKTKAKKRGKTHPTATGTLQ